MSPRFHIAIAALVWAWILIVVFDVFWLLGALFLAVLALSIFGFRRLVALVTVGDIDSTKSPRALSVLVFGSVGIAFVAAAWKWGMLPALP